MESHLNLLDCHYIHVNRDIKEMLQDNPKAGKIKSVGSLVEAQRLDNERDFLLQDS